MIIRTNSISSSSGGQEVEELAFVYCRDESGYCVSVCWIPGDELAEVMVVDQIVHRTRDLVVILVPEKLTLQVSPAASKHLDGITEYVIPLSLCEDELHELDAALLVILADGRGQYLRDF